MTSIHATAQVETSAIGENVTIGPYCVIGPDVVISEGCRLVAHVHVAGHTTIGPRTVIYPFASLGTPPQSVHYKGEPTRLRIGADCVLRESVTMNIGTTSRGETVIGDHCLLMTGAHVGHDSIVGHHVTFANCATLGGHAEIGDYAFLGGLCAVHQFCRVGEQAIIGGLVGVTRDVIPFASVIGHRGELAGLNVVGLKRRGVSRNAIHALRSAYRDIFFGSGTFAERVETTATAYAEDANVMRVVEFIRATGKRRLSLPREMSDGD